MSEFGRMKRQEAKERTIRNDTPMVKEAYDQYQMLLKLADDGE